MLIIPCPLFFCDCVRSGRNMPVRACATMYVAPLSPGCEKMSMYIATLQYGNAFGALTTGRSMPRGAMTTRVTTRVPDGALDGEPDGDPNGGNVMRPGVGVGVGVAPGACGASGPSARAGVVYERSPAAMRAMPAAVRTAGTRRVRNRSRTE